jgi:hypothetical protein
MSQTHDQNFKNLILDYPVQAIEFFAPQEANTLDEPVKVTPLRQEQLKNKFGDRCRELDTPLMFESHVEDNRHVILDPAAYPTRDAAIYPNSDVMIDYLPWFVLLFRIKV